MNPIKTKWLDVFSKLVQRTDSGWRGHVRVHRDSSGLRHSNYFTIGRRRCMSARGLSPVRGFRTV